MLRLAYDSLNFFFPIFWSLSSCWLFFFYYISLLTRTIAVASNDKISFKVKKNAESLNMSFFDFFLVILFFFFCFIFILKGWVNSFFFSCFYLNSFIIYFILLYTFLFFIFIFYLRQLSVYVLIFDFDFFFSFFNFFFTSLLFFITKSFTTFFFILELVSCFIFFQFIVSKTFFRQIKNSSIANFSFIQNKQILSLLFFQYWASFFSSVIFVYILSFLLFSYGSSDWFVLNNLFTNLLLYSWHTDTFFYFFLFFFFTVSFFLKLGFTPVQLFKIEIYKGLPFLSIFLYTFFYFFVYFFVYFFITFYYFTSYWFLVWYFFFFLFFFGSFYILGSLFEVKILKAFFAYSTIINSLGFLTLFLVLIS